MYFHKFFCQLIDADGRLNFTVLYLYLYPILALTSV